MNAEALPQGVVAALADMVAFPTVSRTPNGPLLRWLGGQLEERGATVDVVAGSVDRGNLVARFGPDTDGGLMLAGHTDVVPPGDGWDSDPWTLEVRNDRFCGRGTADMKGFFAALLAATADLAVDRFTVPLRVVASYDEEIGCRGVLDVLPALAADPMFAPALVVVGEPTMMVPRFTHLGKRGYHVVVRATEAHSSRAGREPSAISHAARLVAVLDEIQSRSPVGDSPAFTVNCGRIEGGTQTNVIAARCELHIEVRHDIDHHPDVVLAPWWAAVERQRAELAERGGMIDVEEVTRYPAMCTDIEHPMVRLVERLADAGPVKPLGFGTEGGLYAETLRCPVVICGPGDIADAHRPNEFVAADQLRRSVGFLRSLIEQVCESR